ncbi:MAG: PHP domain-containing protein [bacterium]
MLPKADLHTHTFYSDGALSPVELIDKAKQNGITVLSITDHDSINGITEAVNYAKSVGIEIIPGVEISTDVEDKEIHLLGYFIDIENVNLKNYLSFFRIERLNRAKRIIEKLNYLGVKITLDDVVKKAQLSSIGRPHIANALVDLGVVSNFYEAFEKYLRDNGPAYEKKNHLSAFSAIKLISDAGGLTVLAHPGFVNESILTSLIKSGIDGIEVIHPSHNESQVKFYRGIVNSFFMLQTGGSDFHGGHKNDEQNMGKFYISPKLVDTMRKLVYKHSA